MKDTLLGLILAGAMYIVDTLHLLPMKDLIVPFMGLMLGLVIAKMINNWSRYDTKKN